VKTPIGSLNPAIRTVHIWGGGVAGLLMGHFLSRQGFEIQLYEKTDRLGGKIQSHKLPEGVIEEGPNAIFATAEIETWLYSLGLTVIPATPKLKRRLWNGIPIAPMSLGLALKLIAKLFKRTPSVSDGITVAQFFRPLLGEHVETLLTPALQGVYGCGADELTIASVWPQLKAGRYWQVLRSLKNTKARSVSFPKGMAEFIQALASSIKGKIHLNYTGAFELRPNTIICTEAPMAALLLNGSWAEGARLLQRLEYLPLSSATVLASEIPETRGVFGYLFPRASGVNALGALFNREIFPQRAGVTFILPGTDDVEARVKNDLQRLSWPAGPLRVHSWAKALPRYNQTRTTALKALQHDPERPFELVLFGNYVAGISLRDMIQTASSFAGAHAPL